MAKTTTTAQEDAAALSWFDSALNEVPDGPKKEEFKSCVQHRVVADGVDRGKNSCSMLPRFPSHLSLPPALCVFFPFPSTHFSSTLRASPLIFSYRLRVVSLSDDLQYGSSRIDAPTRHLRGVRPPKGKFNSVLPTFHPLALTHFSFLMIVFSISDFIAPVWIDRFPQEGQRREERQRRQLGSRIIYHHRGERRSRRNPYAGLIRTARFIHAARNDSGGKYTSP